MSTFKVMTFNIRGSQFDDGENIWPNRADLNVRTIKHYDPDLIGFQEFELNNQKHYSTQLGNYISELGPEYGNHPERFQYNAIYWKPERFEKIDNGGFYISPTPETYSRGWDTSVVRSANWVLLRDKIDGNQFFYLNHHLDHIGEQARVEGAKLVIKRALERTETANLPVLVTADFNSRAWQPPNEDQSLYPEPIRPNLPPGGTVHGLYTDAGFVDTFTEAGHLDTLETNTVHAFVGDAFPAVALRIDWIMLHDGNQKFKTLSCETIRDCEPPLYPSDHYPVLAEISLT